MEFDINKLAYCGIYCPQCSFMAAGETENRAHLLHMPSKYDYYKDVKLSACACDGCKDENICGECAMKDCTKEKGLASCADCDSFPCSTLQGFAEDGVPHHRWAIENLTAIKALGYVEWFAGFKESLYCHCGERLSWYYKCPLHENE